MEATFEKFGKLVDVLMPKKKSYAFVIYEDKQSTIRAIENLQAQVITENQTPICFYMFPVDKGKLNKLGKISKYREIID